MKRNSSGKSSFLSLFSLKEKNIYQPPADTADRFYPDPDFGLSSDQVRSRKEDGYVNNRGSRGLVERKHI